MSKEMISTEGAPRAIGPYSQAVKAGGMVFLSGQLGMDPATGELAEGLEAQVRRALDNLVAVLTAAGTSAANVVKTTVYLAAMEDFAAMNAIYGDLFSNQPPARATVAVKTLPKNALFEIDAIALVD